MKITPEISDQKRDLQEAFYDQIQIKDLDSHELVKYFVDSEKEAEKYKFQGTFYPSAYFDIKKLIGSAMIRLSKEEIKDLFYFTLKNNNIFPFKEKHYPIFLESIELLMPAFESGDYDKCHLTPNKLHLLLEIKGKKDLNKLNNTSYKDFMFLFSFINKAWSFSNYPSMRKKAKNLESFLQSKLLMNRIREGVPLFLNFDHLSAASLILLLMDENDSSKECLLNFQKQNLERKLVWVLGSFYMDFNKSNSNKDLLNDLLTKYPNEWINEYE